MVGSGSLDGMDCLVYDDQEFDVMNFIDFPLENFEEGECNGGHWPYDLPSFPVIDDKSSHLKQHLYLSEEPSKASIPLHSDSSDGLKKGLFQPPDPVTDGLKPVLKSTSPTSVSDCLHSRLSQEPDPISVSDCVHSGLSQASNQVSISTCVLSGSSEEPSQVSVSEGLNSVGFQAPSPDSVLESSQSCSGERTILAPFETSASVCPRSKRIKKTTCKTWFDSGESSVKKKPKKEKKLSQLLGDLKRKDDVLYSKQPTSTKKCLHCEATESPQWREGPMGRNTLCNACGVRYRSGRLFPEYRPASSPTFVPTLHSNSHKKVIEMRKGNTAIPTPRSNSHRKVTEMRKRCIREAKTESAFSRSVISETGSAFSRTVRDETEPTVSDRAMSPPPEFVPWDCAVSPPHEFVPMG